MTPEQLQQLLRQYKLTPNKVLGQNFLLDDFIIQDIADSAEIQPGEAVLEIGPGIATLTLQLIKRADFVLSVEKDTRFKTLLGQLAHDHKNFHFEISDILHFDFQNVLEDFQSYVVVANIPYYITGKIIQMFVAARRRPRSLTLLVQKEVAQNLTASAGDLNLLAISVQLEAQTKLIQQVPAKSFYPAPKVDSAVVQISFLDKPLFPEVDRKKLFRILRACFAGKRKQLHNTLKNNLHLSSEQVSAVLAEAEIGESMRPQQLSLEQWANLYHAIERQESAVEK